MLKCIDLFIVLMYLATKGYTEHKEYTRNMFLFPNMNHIFIFIYLLTSVKNQSTVKRQFRRVIARAWLKIRPWFYFDY